MTIQKNKERSQTAQIKPLLQAWWGDPSSFVKVPASGALRWKDNKFWTFSDLVPPVDFPFCVELKNHADWDLYEPLRKGLVHNKLTWYWYYQVVKDSLRATAELGQSIYPLMIFKITRQANCMVMQSNLFFGLPAEILESLIYFEFRIPQCQSFIVTDLKNFLEKVPRPLFEKHILKRTPKALSA